MAYDGDLPTTEITQAQMEELWRAAFGTPPPIICEPDMMLQVLIRCLPTPPWRPHDQPMS